MVLRTLASPQYYLVANSIAAAAEQPGLLCVSFLQDICSLLQCHLQLAAQLSQHAGFTVAVRRRGVRHL